MKTPAATLLSLIAAANLFVSTEGARTDGTLDASPSPRQGGPSSDGVIQVRRIASFGGNAVETTLTLVLRGPQGDQLPLNLAFRTVHEDRTRSDEPSVFSVLVVLSPVFVGVLDFTRPHLVFVGDEGRASAAVVSASVDAPFADTFSWATIEPFSLDDLTRLGGAATLSGRLFDMAFTLTPEQVHALTEFSQRARRRPNAPGIVR